MQAAVVHVTAEQYLSGWRREARTIFLPAFSLAGLGDTVAARVALAERDAEATIVGTVRLVRRVGRPTIPPGAELVLDPDSARTAEWLADAAFGKHVPFRCRAPRFAIARQLTVRHHGVALAVVTANVSSTGAALRWMGPLPTAGEPIALRLGGRLFARNHPAIVAWVEGVGEARSRVGVRLAPGAPWRDWARLADEAQRTGAIVL